MTTLRWIILCDRVDHGSQAVTLNAVRDVFRVSAFPVSLRVAVAAVFDVTESTEHVLRFDIHPPGGPVLVGSDAPLPVPNFGSAHVSDLLRFTASRAGLLYVVVMLDGVEAGRAPLQLIDRAPRPTVSH